MNYCITNDELYHHGILGQKWGIRRFQNKDGSLIKARKRSKNSKKRATLKSKLGTPRALAFLNNASAFQSFQRQVEQQQFQQFMEQSMNQSLNAAMMASQASIGAAMAASNIGMNTCMSMPHYY